MDVLVRRYAVGVTHGTPRRRTPPPVSRENYCAVMMRPARSRPSLGDGGPRMQVLTGSGGDFATKRKGTLPISSWHRLFPARVTHFVRDKLNQNKKMHVQKRLQSSWPTGH